MLIYQQMRSIMQQNGVDKTQRAVNLAKLWNHVKYFRVEGGKLSLQMRDDQWVDYCDADRQAAESVVFELVLLGVERKDAEGNVVL